MKAQTPSGTAQLTRQKANSLLQKGKLQKAKTLYEKILKNFHNDPEIYLILGYISGQTNETNNAIYYLAKASTLQPKNPQTYYNLGVAYQNKEDHEHAIVSFSKALELSPTMIEAKYNLAVSLHNIKKHNEAIALLNELQISIPENTEILLTLASCFFSIDDYEQTIKLTEQITNNNKSPKAFSLMGAAMLESGLKSAALTAFRDALILDPTYSEALIGLGLHSLKESRLEQSASFFKQALQQDPNNLVAILKLAQIYVDLARPDDAILCYKNALKLDAKSEEALYGLANAQEMAGNWDNAIATYEQMIEADINKNIAEAGLAHIYERKHKPDKAMAILQRQLEIDEPLISTLCTYANLSRENKSYKDPIIRCEAALSRKNITNHDKRLLHYTLGKLYNDAKNYESAFKNFLAGNELEKEIHWHQYNATKQKDFVNWCIEKYSIPEISRLSIQPNKSAKPVFVIGMPRSGTSLTEQIIATHPDAYGAGELPDIYDFAQSLPENIGNIKDQELAGSLDFLNQERLTIFSKKYLETISRQSPNALRVVDKMPGNFLYLGLIKLIFPNAYILHCRRNPIDTCLSIYFQQFTSSQSYSNSLIALGQYYCEYDRLMKHWTKIFPGQILEVNYEQLILNHEIETRKIIKFIELEWDDRCLKFYKNKRDVNTPSYQQVRQPIYKSSMERWRNYEPFISDLIKALSPVLVNRNINTMSR